MKDALEDKINPKQWLPLYGVFHAFDDRKGGKPSIVTQQFTHPIKYISYMAYQSASLTTLALGVSGIGHYLSQ